MELQLLYGYMQQVWTILWIVLGIQLLGVAALVVLTTGISMIKKRARRGHATPMHRMKADRVRKFDPKLMDLKC